VKTVRSALPELDLITRQPVAAPVGRALYVSAAKVIFGGGHATTQLCSVFDDGRLL
jgi:hypothetical protein